MRLYILILFMVLPQFAVSKIKTLPNIVCFDTNKHRYNFYYGPSSNAEIDMFDQNSQYLNSIEDLWIDYKSSSTNPPKDQYSFFNPVLKYVAARLEFERGSTFGKGEIPDMWKLKCKRR